jgi:hypothetical protein
VEHAHALHRLLPDDPPPGVPRPPAPARGRARMARSPSRPRASGRASPSSFDSRRFLRSTRG